MCKPVIADDWVIVMATMAEFLQTGRLGEIEIGITLDKARAVLGSPDDQSAAHKFPALLRYGAIQLCFRPIGDTGDSRLVTIAIYFHDPSQSIPDILRPADWVPTRETTTQQFLQWLSSSGISVHSTVQGEAHYLVLESGASIVFAEGHLYSINFKRGSSRHTRKQLTVSLPNETIDQLRERAKRDGVSVPQLLERIIHGE